MQIDKHLSSAPVSKLKNTLSCSSAIDSLSDGARIKTVPGKWKN